jgi:HlyD family secretion protein
MRRQVHGRGMEQVEAVVGRLPAKSIQKRSTPENPMRTMPEQCTTILAGMLILLVAGCHRGSEATVNESPSTSAVVPERVTVGKPQRKTLVLTTTQPARIEAFEETPLYAKLAGFVKEVHVDIGDHVSAGQSLVTLSIPELVDEVVQKEALVARAEAEIDQAASLVKAAQAAAATAKAKIAESQAGVTRAQAEYDRWQAEYNRIKQLTESGSVTQKLRDETLNQFQATQAAQEEAAAVVASAEASAEEAAANITKAEADASAADAQLNVARADLARAKTMLTYAEIRSPYDGVVTQRSVDTGHFVQPAGGADAKPLLVVARIDKVRVFLEIPEMEAGQLDVGDEVTLSVQALRGKTMKSKIARTSWSLDRANRSLRAEVDIENEGSLLRPGMYALGIVQLARRDDVLALPTTAVFHADNKDFCCVVASGTVDRREVNLGLQTASEVEVESGLDSESGVVLARGESLSQGQQVMVTATP